MILHPTVMQAPRPPTSATAAAASSRSPSISSISSDGTGVIISGQSGRSRESLSPEVYYSPPKHTYPPSMGSNDDRGSPVLQQFVEPPRTPDVVQTPILSIPAFRKPSPVLKSQPITMPMALFPPPQAPLHPSPITPIPSVSPPPIDLQKSHFQKEITAIQKPWLPLAPFSTYYDTSSTLASSAQRERSVSRGRTRSSVYVQQQSYPRPMSNTSRRSNYSPQSPRSDLGPVLSPSPSPRSYPSKAGYPTIVNAPPYTDGRSDQIPASYPPFIRRNTVTRTPSSRTRSSTPSSNRFSSHSRSPRSGSLCPPQGPTIINIPIPPNPVPPPPPLTLPPVVPQVAPIMPLNGFHSRWRSRSRSRTPPPVIVRPSCVYNSISAESGRRLSPRSYRTRTPSYNNRYGRRRHSPDFKRHPKFCFDDGNVIFQVKDTAYRVHRYFFEQNSSMMKTMFTSRSLSVVNCCPVIPLDGVEPHDFERLLTIFYPSNYAQHDAKTTEDWTSVLRAANHLAMRKIGKLAKEKLTTLATSADKIALVKEFEDDFGAEWIVDAFLELATRSEALTVDEGHKIEMEDVIRLGVIRQALTSNIREYLDLDKVKGLVKRELKLVC